MPYIESNILQNIFYSAIKGEFLRIARSTLCLRDFIPKAKELLERMKQQGSKRGTTGTSLRNIILTHPESLQHFSILFQDLLDIFSEDNLYNFSLSVCVYICACINEIYIYMSVYKTVCVSTCVYVSSSVWVHIFQFQSNQKITPKTKQRRS